MSTPADIGPPVQQSVGDRSLGELISEVTEDLSTLMRQELELAKAELQQSATRAGKGAGMLGGAAVAVIWGIVGAVLATVGRNSLRSVRGLPRTADTVKKIPDALKGNE